MLDHMGLLTWLSTQKTRLPSLMRLGALPPIVSREFGNRLQQHVDVRSSDRYLTIRIDLEELGKSLSSPELSRRMDFYQLVIHNAPRDMIVHLTGAQTREISEARAALGVEGVNPTYPHDRQLELQILAALRGMDEKNTTRKAMAIAHAYSIPLGRLWQITRRHQVELC